ncbi:NAD(P)/FAD-dependent oxidoreductase [Modestobacter lapidis]|nr:NAD(P)-binding protein [Modestobacter lapidis]
MDSPGTTVIGSGISGIACARALADAGLTVRVLDRGRQPGGRMGGRTLHGRPVDLGASYLTVPDGSPFAPVVAGWVERGLAHPWTDTFAVGGPDGLTRTTTGPVRYGTAGGLRGLVADLATGLDLVQERTVHEVTADGAGRPSVDGERVDAVVLAMPDPQARRLLPPAGAGPALDPDGWQPSLAIALGWSQRRWPGDLHGVFVHDSPVLDWVADDGDRRGDGAPVLVAHTTPGLAARHLDEPERATAEVVVAVRTLLGIEAEPEWTHVHRWSSARPAHPREQPFALAGRIGVCGDGWAAPARVESAWRSGTALGEELIRTR